MATGFATQQQSCNENFDFEENAKLPVKQLSGEESAAHAYWRTRDIMSGRRQTPTELLGEEQLIMDRIKNLGANVSLMRNYAAHVNTFKQKPENAGRRHLAVVRDALADYDRTRLGIEFIPAGKGKVITYLIPGSGSASSMSDRITYGARMTKG